MSSLAFFCIYVVGIVVGFIWGVRSTKLWYRGDFFKEPVRGIRGRWFDERPKLGRGGETET